MKTRPTAYKKNIGKQSIHLPPDLMDRMTQERGK